MWSYRPEGSEDQVEDVVGGGRMDWKHTSGAKGRTHFQRVTARLKSCPSQEPADDGVFPQPVKSCPSQRLRQSEFFRRPVKPSRAEADQCRAEKPCSTQRRSALRDGSDHNRCGASLRWTGSHPSRRKPRLLGTPGEGARPYTNLDGASAPSLHNLKSAITHARVGGH